MAPLPRKHEDSHDSSSRQPTLLAAACPAFQAGCPYASDDHMLAWIKSKRLDAVKSCPAFKEGCPFHEVQDLASLCCELEKLPPSHAGAGRNGEVEADDASTRPEAHAALLDMLQAVHKASQTVKTAVGGDCPVFQQACPFKNCLTSRGTPLVMELETRSWGLLMRGDAVDDEALAAGAEDQSRDFPSLAIRLKEGTKEAHAAAESVHFIREFIRGRVPRELYAQLIVNLYHVYLALEAALDAHSEHALLESLYFPEELSRAATLKQDAEFFCGSGWETREKPSEVTQEYVQRLQQIAKESPELLVPHAYTRYLGDLSGGQVLRRAAVRALQLPADGSGVKFYIFRRIADVKVFKNMYRARMDNLPADRATADRMVVEANYAFNLNTRIFQELDKQAGFDQNPVLPPSVAPAAADGSPNAAAACPFAALAAQGAAMPADHPPLAGTTPSRPPPPASKPALSATKPKMQVGLITVLIALLAVLAALVLKILR